MHIRADRFRPSSVVIAVIGVDFLVEEMFRLHVFILGDVFWIFSVGTLMTGDQMIAFIRDPDLIHCGFQYDWFIIVGVRHGIIVFFIKQVVVGRHMLIKDLVAESERSAFKRCHIGLVVSFKHFLSGQRKSFTCFVIEFINDRSCLDIDRFNRRIDVLLELL